MHSESCRTCYVKARLFLALAIADNTLGLLAIRIAFCGNGGWAITQQTTTYSKKQRLIDFFAPDRHCVCVPSRHGPGLAWFIPQAVGASVQNLIKHPQTHSGSHDAAEEGDVWSRPCTDAEA